jgi:hypothetical protein
MPAEYTYFRKYIILKNDYTNIANLNPKGHGKIEVRGSKGVISLNVENCELEKDYKVYLLKDKNGEVYEYDLGRIITDEKGRSRTNITLNLRDLESKGFPIDEIDAILIRKGIYVLLGGYIDKDNGAIDRFIKRFILEKKEEPFESFKKIEKKVEKLPETESIEKPEEIIEEIEEPRVVIKEVEEPKIIIEEAEKIQENIEETEIMDEEKVKVDMETIEYNKEEVLENLEEGPEQKEEYEDYQSLEYIRRLNHKNQMTNYILSILRFFPYVQPLKMDLHGYSWWRIDNDGIDSYKGFLPYYNYLMSTNYKYPFLNNSTTCLNLIRKYNHYLFGMYKDGRETKYYIYGVPGSFTVEEHPFKGITGFNTWYESTNGLGYWILYIDPMTGKIIYPLNPMIPAY